MNDKDWLAVKAAIHYIREEPVCMTGTSNEQDTEVEDKMMLAFLAGVQYAENNP